jgi:hypothetical protein
MGNSNLESYPKKLIEGTYPSKTETPSATTTQAITAAQITIAAETKTVTFRGLTPAATEAAAVN